MVISKIYQNLIEDGKIITPVKLANEADRLEKRLRKLEAEQDCNLSKNITAEFIILSTKIQENAFGNGFREGAKLMTECFMTK